MLSRCSPRRWWANSARGRPPDPQREPAPEARRGDLLAIPAAGAYQLSMSSNYNLAPRPAVLWLEDGRVEVLQPREQPEESGWWAGEGTSVF
jgi:hypothetical protein